MTSGDPDDRADHFAEDPSQQQEDPNNFVRRVVGKQVKVRLASGIDYYGILTCLDGYMNLALEKTQERVDGKIIHDYGDAFIRGNNAALVNDELLLILLDELRLHCRLVAMRCLVRKEPRTIAIIGDTGNALLFDSQSRLDNDQCRVDIVKDGTVIEQDAAFRPLSSREIATPAVDGRIFGIIGLLHRENYVFLGIVTAAQRVAQVYPGQPVFKITAVDFICINSSVFDKAYPHDPAKESDDFDDEWLDGPQQTFERAQASQSHPCTPLIKLLGNGSFFCSTTFDLTRRAQLARDLFNQQYDSHQPQQLLPESLSEQSSIARLSELSITQHLINEESSPLDEPPSASSVGQLDISRTVSRYLWNAFLLDPIVKYCLRLENKEQRRLLLYGEFLSCVIRGYSETVEVVIGNGDNAQMTIISRLSRMRAGTRFNSRGIDGHGNVSNSVETEVLVRTESFLMSFCQIRGSVPLFWEQTGFQMFGQKIDISRSPEASRSAFVQHFKHLQSEYGIVEVVNLLGSSSSEHALANMYRSMVASENFRSADNAFPEDKMMGKRKYDENAARISAPLQHIPMIDFDFHGEMKSYIQPRVRELVSESLQRHAFYLEDAEGNVIQRQSGGFRSNCLDCLDRTNVVQGIISHAVFSSFSQQQHLSFSSAFWDAHQHLWADNGDSLSRIYAGTGALNSSYTRSGNFSLSGMFNDFSKTVGRAYVNNFRDKGRQIVIEMLLGEIYQQKPVRIYDPITDAVINDLNKRAIEYTSTRNISIWVGTFNALRSVPKNVRSIAPWFFGSENAENIGSERADIYAVGLQEVVELSASQIFSGDTAPRTDWEKIILRLLNDEGDPANPPALPKRPNDGRPSSVGGQKSSTTRRFLHLRSGQMVGMAIMIFVRADLLPLINDVEGSSRKTGFKGTSGNKGAVAVRFDLGTTGYCFVNAHLPPGLANIEERNRDYRIIDQELSFRRERRICDHHAIFWFGDLNYRLTLDYNTICMQIAAGDLKGLQKYDQLQQQMKDGKVFKGYTEQHLDFAPTYKFDVGTNRYDSSENPRAPAWTDRIVCSGEAIMTSSDYRSAADILLSDHKPVSAAYFTEANIMDMDKKNEIMDQLFKERYASGVSKTGTQQGTAVFVDSQQSSNLMDDPMSRELRARPQRPSRPSFVQQQQQHQELDASQDLLDLSIDDDNSRQSNSLGAIETTKQKRRPPATIPRGSRAGTLAASKPVNTKIASDSNAPLPPPSRKAVNQSNEETSQAYRSPDAFESYEKLLTAPILPQRTTTATAAQSNGQSDETEKSVNGLTNDLLGSLSNTENVIQYTQVNGSESAKRFNEKDCSAHGSNKASDLGSNGLDHSSGYSSIQGSADVTEHLGLNATTNKSLWNPLLSRTGTDALGHSNTGFVARPSVKERVQRYEQRSSSSESSSNNSVKSEKHNFNS